MKPVEGFPNYQITEDGQVWSNKHKKFLRQYFSHNGYLFLRLWCRTKWGYKNCRISRLVLQTFVGPCPDGMECCHNNGIRTDNRLSNLRWDTRKANHAERDTAKGSRHGMAKLTESDARFIVYMRRTELFTYLEIGKFFNVTLQMVRYIVKRKNWKHIWKGKI